MTLPPLPEPAYSSAYLLPACKLPPVYTEAQMLAYRAAVVEACAKVADNIVIQTVGHSAATADQIADEIRSMK